MVKKTEVIICDSCNSRVAINKCDICKIDLCKDCSQDIRCNLGDNFKTRMLDLTTCKECKKRSYKIVEEDCSGEQDMLKKTNKFYIDLIKNKGILNELEK